MANDFPRFRHLPTELRLKIWSFCIPGRRVYEMDTPLTENHDTFPRGADRELQSSKAGRFPVTLRVCRESREVVLKSHLYMTSLYETGEVPGADEDGVRYPPWSAWNANLPVRLRKGFDIVHLHWHTAYDNHVWLTAGPNPWPSFRWLSNQAAAASVSAELLLPFDDQKSKTFIKGAEQFSPQVLYYVVLAIVEMHMSDDEAAQAHVFGAMGEEPIQLVDPRDTATVARFRDAWRRHRSPSEEPDVAEFFAGTTTFPAAEAYCARVERWRQNLEKAWLWSQCIALGVPDDARAAIWPDPDRPAEGPFTLFPVFPLPTVFPPPALDWTSRKLNREHRWVQAQLRQMPRFEPALMFRHCKYMCGLAAQ